MYGVVGPPNAAYRSFSKPVSLTGFGVQLAGEDGEMNLKIAEFLPIGQNEIIGRGAGSGQILAFDLLSYIGIGPD
jgi:hypothetical protein